ncbi:MAG: hypothetical protein LUD27_00800 [Clostridia bacterium]|nr:hypothetical protein [Clostridia bacterium]
MKRKLLLIFLTIISAASLSLSVSACDFLIDNVNSGAEQSASQSSSNSDVSEQTSSEDDSSGQTSSEEDSSGQTSSEDSSDTEKEETEDFEVREGNSSYGYYQLAGETNGASMQSVYLKMYTACESFTENTGDISAANGYYTISEISYSDCLTTEEALSVWKIFYLENPMYYWLSSSCVYSTSKIYLCIDEAYASYADRAVYDAAIAAMITEANSLVSQQSTELEKAMAIHDYIIGKIDYAYQSDKTTPETAIWAHNITGVSSKGAGVCEAYAKTYLALSLINGLDCVIATGYSSSSGEAHAWNLVKIDGAWYGVDCTWDDTGDDSDLSYTYFGMNASAISSTRVTNGQTYGTSYLYALPEATTYGIQLVTLFKGETQSGVYVNIDAAFAAMTDSAADYTIELYFYNPAGALIYTSPSTTVYIYSESTPAVNSVTINGVYTDLGDGYFYVSYLNMESELTLNCNLTVCDVILTAAKLNLGEYTLTAGGNYCRLNGTIYDSKTSEVISVKSATTSQTDIYAALNISYYYGGASISGTAAIGTYYGSDRLAVYGTVTIDKYISANQTSYYNIYMQEGGSLTVNSVVYDGDGSDKIVYVLFRFDSIEKYPSLYLGGVAAQVRLYISGNVSSSEAAAPSNLDCAIAALGSESDFDYIKIYFDGENKTGLYSVNTDYEIVYTPQTAD